MRQSILYLCFLLFLGACSNEPASSGKRVQEIKPSKISNKDIIRNPVSADLPIDTINVAIMTFEETEYEFGAVLEGAQVKHTYKFTNTGTVPLIISDARSTCGCTVPEWPKKPIPPGGKGEIKVSFNTANKIKDQVKQVTLTANTYPSMTKLFIKGYVQPNPARQH